MGNSLGRLVLATWLALALGTLAAAAPAASYRGEAELSILLARLSRHQARIASLSRALTDAELDAGATREIIAAGADAERTLSEVDLALRLDSLVTAPSKRETAQTLVVLRVKKSAAHLEALVREVQELVAEGADPLVSTATHELAETLDKSRLMLMSLQE